MNWYLAKKSAAWWCVQSCSVLIARLSLSKLKINFAKNTKLRTLKNKFSTAKSKPCPYPRTDE